MDPSQLIQAVAGPYGALILAVVAVVVLWKKLEAAQEVAERAQEINKNQQDLFEKALDLIKEDLVPLVQELSKRPASRTR